ncbi:DNA/RNA non-specific endonuclease [Sphingobium chlorophenolicum]|uniref:LysM domain-containing protein n=1 Tax=Sphingobium chlorophenolicum TaxID=46429 RepID=A0A081R8X5_SPHCR|nr:DNA/RNA non-specific endonuclease [Sphingobium chlorophenolicum]KEQ51648.1 LysM domain-containing protein [Sphingobium chlorophenolicum]
MKPEETGDEDSLRAFGHYLRTGQRLLPDRLEVKFNPWHDEKNGRFTFVGQGRYFGGEGSANNDLRYSQRGDAGGKATAKWDRADSRADDDGVPDRSHFHPDHPSNYSLYTVQPGDSLSRIAALRKGLKASDLAWLNEMPLHQTLKVGQQIKLPHQRILDAGREAKNKFLALAYYMDSHDGKFPPNPANPPSLESQILNSNWKRESKNGYDFYIDMLARLRRVGGNLSDGPTGARSRRNQLQAGRPNRRPSDDGGHFIASRFNGPSDSFNHFAQEANFNRGAYRAIEDGWAKELQKGHKVFVDIVPHYEGTSRRPDSITVTWFVDGQRRGKIFSNETKGRSNGKK